MGSAFDQLSRIRAKELFDGVRARALHGDHITMAVVELEPGAEVVEHSHENEQLGMVLRGELTLRVGDEERALGPDETWCIAPHVVHSGRAGSEGALVLDVFSPPRSDWD
jgi:quercetin dioxygenase-like cupin family protein